jgi:hypothetical protein
MLKTYKPVAPQSADSGDRRGISAANRPTISILLTGRNVMRNIKRHFVAAVGTLAVFLLPLHVALADFNSFTRDAGELGCIMRQPGSAKFLGGDLPDKKAIGEAVVNAHRLWGAKVIDPCLSGQLRNLPAEVYAALAEKHPEKFQPLEAGNQSVVLPKEATAASGASGAAPEYHYVWLDELTPPGFAAFFDPWAITNGGRVYGNTYDESLVSYVTVFEHGNMTVLHEGFATTANQGGTVGGWVVTDPENFLSQAALFRGDGVELIPRLPGEISSEVIRLNDSGTALIFSVDESFIGRAALYKNGQVTPPLDFGPDIPFAFFLSMNNQGTISGTTFIDGLGYRGFRFDPRTGKATLLEPLPTEPEAWALDINNRGDILGYSFIGGATERIGVWDRNGEFHTYFVEGTADFPTVSNDLHFNDNNLIVITRVVIPDSEIDNSYLVPKPGVRLNLADLVEDMPPEHGRLRQVRAVNNHGNMIGWASPPNFFDFLLERTSAGGE